MGRRLELQAILVEILGSPHVYFQPPPNITLQYPCIVYYKERFDTRNADNLKYKKMTKYQVTAISQDPESNTPDKILDIPLTSHNSHFVKDNLYQDVFTIYF